MRILAILFAAAVLAALTWTQYGSEADDPQQRLVGTWLREYDENTIHIRRVLVLGPHENFDESSRDVVAGQADALHHHSGRWLFDGTNLKRHYTRLDGKPLGAPTVPFATFELRFESSHEFIGIDHVHQRQIRYRRVPDGTLP